MSLTSLILSLAIIPLKAIRQQPTKSKRELELEAEVRRLSFALDYWRNAASALMLENERLRANSLATAISKLDHVIRCSPNRASLIAPTNSSN
jgi:type II secretory pathway component PulJ